METLSEQETLTLLDTLKTRFENNMTRHEGLNWTVIQTKILNNPIKLKSLHGMESTGGHPDIVHYDSVLDIYLFYDTSYETPKERCSLCYDDEALHSRKANKPRSSAIQIAIEMGVELLDEAQYRFLQTLGEFDLKTSSWIKTPVSIRVLKGALFAERRYNQVYVYRNGAESYYAARGFRTFLCI